MTKVIYQGGQSRHGVHAVDYMLVNVDGVELYAELIATDDENGNYNALKSEILEQAKAKGIDSSELQFWYD